MSLPLKLYDMSLLLQFSCSFVFAFCLVPENMERQEKEVNETLGIVFFFFLFLGRNKRRNYRFSRFRMTFGGKEKKSEIRNLSLCFFGLFPFLGKKDGGFFFGLSCITTWMLFYVIEGTLLAFIGFILGFCFLFRAVACLLCWTFDVIETNFFSWFGEVAEKMWETRRNHILVLPFDGS